MLVDDLHVIELEGPEDVGALLADAEPVYSSHGWIAKVSKREPAAKQHRKVVGVNANGDVLCLRPPTAKLLDTCRTCWFLANSDRVSVAAVDRVMHIPGWYIPLLRSSMSIFEVSHRWLNDHRTVSKGRLCRRSSAASSWSL